MVLERNPVEYLLEFSLSFKRTVEIPINIPLNSLARLLFGEGDVWGAADVRLGRLHRGGADASVQQASSWLRSVGSGVLYSTGIFQYSTGIFQYSTGIFHGIPYSTGIFLEI